ncbi:MAG: hypothetical protein QW397_04310 [Fervidicoccaceae archaeon]|uniref:hypothetical protein n=1 Tax=Desulfurococcus sp. TaxID=51678 RepID=UPI003174C713
MYPFQVIARSTFNEVLGTINLVLVIMPHSLPVEVVNYLHILLSYYNIFRLSSMGYSTSSGSS